jgi:hypothetical protein
VNSDRSPPGSVSMLEKIDTQPRSQGQAALKDCGEMGLASATRK